MKFAIALIAATVVSGSALATTFDCSGIQTGEQPVLIKVQANQQIMTVAMVRPGDIPNPLNTNVYTVVAVRPMFPVYSITAKKDLRPVDGALNVVTLSISAELMKPTGNPARLTIESTGLRGGHTVNQYAVTCAANN